MPHRRITARRLRELVGDKFDADELARLIAMIAPPELELKPSGGGIQKWLDGISNPSANYLPPLADILTRGDINALYDSEVN